MQDPAIRNHALDVMGQKGAGCGECEGVREEICYTNAPASLNTIPKMQLSERFKAHINTEYDF